MRGVSVISCLVVALTRLGLEFKSGPAHETGSVLYMAGGEGDVSLL